MCALMLMGVADGLPLADRQRWATVFASFIQHAWNPEAGRFRNFMAFDRSWCEDVGSEDSNGRALWVLGHAVAHAPDAGLKAWARQWYDVVLGPLSAVEYPRSMAFAMLGAAHVLAVEPDHRPSRELVERGGALLHALLAQGRRPDWAWFEAMLGYDNPRLPEALIRAGHLMNRADWLESGLEALRFIVSQQTTATGQFRAIGSETFTQPHAVSYEAKPFDQQPLEAWAAVEACAAAWHAQAAMDHGDTASRRCGAAMPRRPIAGSWAPTTVAWHWATWSPGAAATASPRAGSMPIAGPNRSWRSSWRTMPWPGWNAPRGRALAAKPPPLRRSRSWRNPLVHPAR
jgi:hypothetical protein